MVLTHPLAAQLQDCKSPSSILDVLQRQVQDLNQSQRQNESCFSPAFLGKENLDSPPHQIRPQSKSRLLGDRNGRIQFGWLEKDCAFDRMWDY